MCPIFHSDDTNPPLAYFSDHVTSLILHHHHQRHPICLVADKRHATPRHVIHPSIMPKAQQKSVKRQKTSDTPTDRPKRATKRPHRYRQDDRIQASDNESRITSDPDSDDSRHTLEARIRALESVIANRASTKNTKQPETAPQDPLPSTSKTAKHSRAKNRTRNPKQYHSTPISTDDEHSAKRSKKKRVKKSKRTRKSHDVISTDSSSDEESYSRKERKVRRKKTKNARKSHRRSQTRHPVGPVESSTSSSSSSSSSCSSESSDSSGSDTDSGSSSNFNRPIDSFGMLLGHNVSEKLKKKIIENKYVEFSRLLPDQSLTLETEPGHSTSVQEDKDHNLKLVKPKQKPIYTITQWSEAWEIYLAVYTSVKRNRKHIQAMLTYARDVRNMAKQNYDWLAFDRQFRSDREKTKCSWATVRHDLHLMYRNPTQQHTPFRKHTKSNSQSLVTPDGQVIPKGLCIKFNTRGQRCSLGNSCSYSHRCPKCNAFHTLYESCADYLRRYETKKSSNTPPTHFRNKPPSFKTDRRQ